MNDTYTIEANDDYAREVTTADDAVSENRIKRLFGYAGGR
jgi:hypothetical protein